MGQPSGQFAAGAKCGRQHYGISCRKRSGSADLTVNTQMNYKAGCRVVDGGAEAAASGVGYDG